MRTSPFGIVDRRVSKLLTEQRIRRLHELLVQIVVRKFGAEGVRLSKAQKAKLLRYIKDGGDKGALRFKTPAKKESKKMSIALTSREVRRLGGKLNALTESDAVELVQKEITAAIPLFRRSFAVSGHLKPARRGHFKTGHPEGLRPMRRESQKGRDEPPHREPSTFDSYVISEGLVRPADRP